MNEPHSCGRIRTAHAWNELFDGKRNPYLRYVYTNAEGKTFRLTQSVPMHESDQGGFRFKAETPDGATVYVLIPPLAGDRQIELWMVVDG